MRLALFLISGTILMLVALIFSTLRSISHAGQRAEKKITEVMADLDKENFCCQGSHRCAATGQVLCRYYSGFIARNSCCNHARVEGFSRYCGSTMAQANADEER